MHAVRGQRGGAYWRVSGWIWGALSVAGGGINLALGDGWNAEGFTALGVTGVAAGGLCLATTIWAWTRPERPAQRLALVPLSAVDARGALVSGAAVRLAGW